MMPAASPLPACAASPPCSSGPPRPRCVCLWLWWALARWRHVSVPEPPRANLPCSHGARRNMGKLASETTRAHSSCPAHSRYCPTPCRLAPVATTQRQWRPMGRCIRGAAGETRSVWLLYEAAVSPRRLGRRSGVTGWTQVLGTGGDVTSTSPRMVSGLADWCATRCGEPSHRNRDRAAYASPVMD